MIESTGNGVVINVRVIPRWPRSGIAGCRGGALLVRLHAPPVEGAANDELIDVIADALKVPRRAVSIVSGTRSRQKRILVAGIDSTGAEPLLTNRRG